MTPCEIITFEQLNAILHEAYNPPKVATDADKHAFHEEYWAAHSRIEEALNPLGRADAIGDGDYTLNEDWYLSRGISIQLTSEAMMTAELVPTIQNVLRQLPERYSVYLDHSLLDLDLFFLLIEPDFVSACGQDLRFLDRLGLAAPTGR